MIQRPAGNIVLEFKENNFFLGLNRKITVWSTLTPDKFKVQRGISANNQLINTEIMDVAGIKQLWIDSVVNGFDCIRNEVFPRGILDCVPEELVKPILEAPRIDQTQFLLSGTIEVENNNLAIETETETEKKEPSESEELPSVFVTDLAGNQFEYPMLERNVSYDYNDESVCESCSG